MTPLRIVSSVVFLVVSTLLAASPAGAHAMLKQASPAVGTTVSAPKMLVLWFTESLEPTFSGVEVRNAQGAAVTAGKAVVDPGDGTKLRVALKPLPPGTYTVTWHVLSVDTHRTQGNFTFTVDH